MSVTWGVLQVHRYYGNEKVCSVAQELYSAMKSSFVTPGQPAPTRGQGVGRGQPMMTARGGAGGHAPSRFNRAGGKGKRGKSAPVKVSRMSHNHWLLVCDPLPAAGSSSPQCEGKAGCGLQPDGCEWR